MDFKRGWKKREERKLGNEKSRHRRQEEGDCMAEREGDRDTHEERHRERESQATAPLSI